MCKVLEIVKKPNTVFVYCTPNNGEFMNSRRVKFVAGNKSFIVEKFSVDKTMQCFNSNPISPIIKLDEDIPETFLRTGNEIVFEY